MTEHVDRSEPEAGAAPTTAAVTPADAADAARLVAFGLQPKLLPARDQEYADLLRRYREDPPFARLADAVAAGLGLVVLEVSPRAGMAVTAAEDSVFAVRMGDYARRAATDSGDRFLHGLAHLAVAAMAYPRPEDLADDGYIGRVTVNGVDAFVRQACRRLEERAEQQGENTDPATDAPGLEAAWRIWVRRSATGATKDARRLPGSTTGIVGKAAAFLTESGFLQRTGDDHGGTYRTTARYQLQVRDMAGSAAMTELLDLGVVPVTDGTATLLPAEETDDLELVADAGLPFHSSSPHSRPTAPAPSERPAPSVPTSENLRESAMYELSRVRLYSIGPAGARYADTVLDLRGVGEPVPDPAPTQAEFFEEEPVGPPRRPAPAGVLFLENGGGKSVLLKLIFSVMLPGHRNTLGGASSGVLRKFLLADDCGHVVLEWQHVQTGECVVVGKVSEWRGRQVSGDPRKFAEAWYSFRPGPGLTLDNLPVAEATAVRPPVEGASGAQGRRRTMKGFRDALTEAGKAYPHLEVHWEEIHDRWIEHLGDLGLDPELFRYQREMNADEGEAAGLFAVKKDSDFTDLLLRAVTDTRDTDGLADLVGGFGNKLGRRAELIAERDFTAGSVDLLGRIAEPPTRTGAPPSAPPTTPAARRGPCAPSAPRSPAPPTTYRKRSPQTAPGRRSRRRPCPTSARPTAPRPRCTRRSESAPTCAPNRPARRATRARPAPSWTGSATRSAPAPERSWNRPTAPTAPPGRPLSPAPRNWSSSWRPVCRARANSSAGCAARPNGTRPRTATPTPTSPRSAARRRARPDPAAHGDRRTRRAHRGPGRGPRRPRRTARRAPRRRGRGRRLRRDRRHAPRPAARTRARGGAGGARALRRRPGGSPQGRGRGPPFAARLRRRPVRRRGRRTRGERRPRPARQLHPLRAGPHPRPPADPRTARRRAARARRQAGRTAFAPRLRVLTDELAQLERNRDSIVDRLRGLVESALATLRSAQRLSRLPEGLGEWSGQEFLRIRFEEPDQATLTERLGEVVDEATRAAVKKNSDLRRDGMSLLLRGVAAALQPKGVAVEILKPDAVLRAERVPVGQMGDVFSGGQLLTAAIALYCTMAALRQQRPGPRPAPPRRHPVPRQPHRPRQRHLSAGAPAGRLGRARRPAPVHHRPVRHDRAGRVPPGHPAAQRRRPQGGTEVHQRGGAPAAGPATADARRRGGGRGGAQRDHGDPHVQTPRTVARVSVVHA
ncbi:hypothetical protein SVIOM342S_02470 [Streptomyces violaceorubidus]